MRNKCLILGKNKNRIVYYSLIIACLVLCCLFSNYKISSIMAFLLFTIYAIVMILDKPRIVLKYLYFFFIITANVAGCFICEFGNIFLVEISTYAHYVGALPFLVLSQLVFLTCIIEADSKYRITQGISFTNSKVSERNLCILNIFVFVLYLILFVHVLPNSALMLNVDRMTFAALGHNSGIWGYLSKWMQFFIVIPIGCITFSRKKTYKIFGLLTLFVYCLYYLWIGDKFGPFFSLFCVFCMLMFSRLDIKEKTLRRLFLVVIAMVLILVFGAAFIFTEFQSQGTTITNYLQIRLAEQGQLFWKTYEVSAGHFHFSRIGNEIAGQFASIKTTRDLIGAKFGIYNIMYLCAPRQKIDAFILYGGRYTEAGYASAFYYFGLFGCVLFAIIFAFVIVSVTNLVIFTTKNNSLLGMIFMVRMYFITCTALSMFLFKDYFTGTSIITYLWILYSTGEKKYLLRRRYKKSVLPF